MAETQLNRAEYPELYKIIDHLRAPLNQIILELRAGAYKDFGLSEESDYPLKGVTYPVEYGYLPGYKGEDGGELDFFVGSEITGGKAGYIKVSRPDVENEHKYYICLSDKEAKDVLKEFAPVILENVQFTSLEELLEAIKKFAV